MILEEAILILGIGIIIGIVCYKIVKPYIVK